MPAGALRMPPVPGGAPSTGWMEPQPNLGHAACWWPCHCRAGLLPGHTGTGQRHRSPIASGEPPGTAGTGIHPLPRLAPRPCPLRRDAMWPPEREGMRLWVWIRGTLCHLQSAPGSQLLPRCSALGLPGDCVMRAAGCTDVRCHALSDEEVSASGCLYITYQNFLLHDEIIRGPSCREQCYE